MPIVIASLVTRLKLVESKKLICENCHSGAAGIRGGRNISVTNYILQRLIKSWLFPILAFSEAPKWTAWANQPIFPDVTTDAFYLFSGFLYLTSSSIIAIDYPVINDRAGARKAAKNWVKQPTLKNQLLACSTIKFGLVWYLEKVLRDLKSFCSS